MSRIFISYSNKDSEFVQRLVTNLETRLPEAHIFYDMLLPVGSSWADTLSQEIDRADVILAVLSPDYLASEWATQELNVALERRINGNATIIPLLVRPCSPGGFLENLTHVDFRGDYEEALARLIWGITGKKPQTARGEEPGIPIESIQPSELDQLRKQVEEAVKLFKSKVEDRDAPGTKSAPSVHDEKGKRCCFIVMPFGNSELQIVYENFVKPVIEIECNLQCKRGDDVFGSNVIVDDILRSIDSADIVVADLTGKNANVFYEIGICHALDKPVLLLAQSIDDVPFDLRHRRVQLYDYSPRGCKRLEGSLKGNLIPESVLNVRVWSLMRPC